MLLQTPAPSPPSPPVIVQAPDVALPPWVILPPQVTGLIVLALIAGCTIVLWPLMRALARRLERGRVGLDPVLDSELEQLRARVADVEQLRHRLAELEERVDFAERLLAQRRDIERLPGG